MKRATLIALALLLVAWTPPERTKTDWCMLDGRLPDRACTPGAVETTSLDVICRTSTRTRRHVGRHLRRRVFHEYGIPLPQPEDAFEVDHLIPLGLGGSNDVANLWPEPAPAFHDKDRIEDMLHERVCSGRMNVEEAQRLIATDWTRVHLAH